LVLIPKLRCEAWKEWGDYEFDVTFVCFSRPGGDGVRRGDAGVAKAKRKKSCGICRAARGLFDGYTYCDVGGNKRIRLFLEEVLWR